MFHVKHRGYKMLIIDGNNITLTRGNTAVIDVTIMDGDNPYNMRDGDTLEFNLKRSCDFNNVLLTKSRIEPSFTFIENDTHNLSLGDYVYSITLRTHTGMVDTILQGKFTLICEVK